MNSKNLKIVTSDPLNILSSTKRVLNNARFVKIGKGKIDELAKMLDQKLKSGLASAGESFGSAGSYEQDVQLIFIEDAVNFCFWAEAGKEKWQVEWQGKTIKGGWYALKTCFERALDAGVPILDARYLADFDKSKAKEFFKSSNGIPIPLLDKRIENLREAGRVLLNKYEGEFINVVKKSNFDAIKLVKILTDDFSSFRDVAELDGKLVYFLKRAQIVACDISYLKTGRGLTNTNQLTAFADYKIPQMLRMFGVIEYDNNLAQRVDEMVLIPAGSREEVEIRAATIWGIELLRQMLKNYSAADVDNALWLLSQNSETQTQPYHRTYTIFY